MSAAVDEVSGSEAPLTTGSGEALGLDVVPASGVDGGVGVLVGDVEELSTSVLVLAWPQPEKMVVKPLL